MQIMYMNCTLHPEDSATIFNSVLEGYYTKPIFYYWFVIIIGRFLDILKPVYKANQGTLIEKNALGMPLQKAW
jgi:hypothetical protein